MHFWEVDQASCQLSMNNTPPLFHPWLADLAAPVGSQEVANHTHKWWQLIGQHLPGCRLLSNQLPPFVVGWQATQKYTFEYIIKKMDFFFFMMYSNFLNKPLFGGLPTDYCGCGQQLPGTQRVGVILLPCTICSPFVKIIRIEKTEFPSWRKSFFWIPTPAYHF